MKSSQLTAAGVVWLALAAAASAHPGHLLDDAALDATHRLGSPHHWLEAGLILTVVLLTAGWMARRALWRTVFAPSTADSLRD